jgi:hypothetical protein
MGQFRAFTFCFPGFFQRPTRPWPLIFTVPQPSVSSAPPFSTSPPQPHSSAAIVYDHSLPPRTSATSPGHLLPLLPDTAGQIMPPPSSIPKPRCAPPILKPFYMNNLVKQQRLDPRFCASPLPFARSVVAGASMDLVRSENPWFWLMRVRGLMALWRRQQAHTHPHRTRPRHQHRIHRVFFTPSTNWKPSSSPAGGTPLRFPCCISGQNKNR